jgi:hypothetical protein
MSRVSSAATRAVEVATALNGSCAPVTSAAPVRMIGLSTTM